MYYYGHATEETHTVTLQNLVNLTKGPSATYHHIRSLVVTKIGMEEVRKFMVKFELVERKLTEHITTDMCVVHTAGRKPMYGDHRMVNRGGKWKRIQQAGRYSL